MTTRFDLVLFDFDGTLVDSEHCIRSSIEAALKDHGCPCDVSDLKRHIGRPLHDAIRAASPDVHEDLLAPLAASYREAYARMEADLVTAFPGVLETLVGLRARGVAMSIATNKTTERTWPSLDRLGLRGFFDVIVGADQVARPKPHSDIADRVLALTGCSPDRALVVGDTLSDLEMAAAAGVNACAVTYGNHSAADLATARPAFIIDALPELIRIVEHRGVSGSAVS